jgi:very-short-patch-repair endonuclease
MTERVNPPLPSRSLDFARQLRRASTEAEHRIWRLLRGSRLNGFKFRRQYAVPPYVLDFYCHSAKLAVELDGSQHSNQIDLERSRFLERQGIRIIRFWDNDVLSRTEAVLESILTSLRAPTLTPTPLPVGEGPKRTNP